MSRPTIDLIDRIGRMEVRPFLAPAPDAGAVVVTTVQAGVQFTYRIEADPGWWVLSCDQSRVLGRRPPTSMFPVVQYLNALPRFLVIVVHRLRTNTWLVTPWNMSDAAQRGWANGEPKAMHLVDDAVRPFDVVVARLLGRTLIYDTVDETLGMSAVSEAARAGFGTDANLAGVRGVTPDMERAAAMLHGYEESRRRSDPERIEAERRQVVENRLAWHLGFMDAELLGWNESGEGYEVRWRHAGREHRTRLRQDLQVSSAGICLDGTDSFHNLSSIVAVMEEHRTEGLDDYGG